MADDIQTSAQGADDDPLIELGEDKVKRSELVALRAKAANLDKDYTEKTTQLAKDKAELDKQFLSVKDLIRFGKLIEEDPEEAERQMRYIIKKYKGGKTDDDDDDDGKKGRRRTEDDDEREQRVYDLELKMELQELGKDPVFKENEEDVMKFALENEIPSVKMAFKAWKGENFEKLHESRLQSVKTKEKESEVVLKGGSSAPSKDWKYDNSKTAMENLRLMRESKK